MRTLLVGLLSLSLFIILTPRAGAADKDHESFQGKWKIEKAQRGGVDMAAEERDNITLEFKGDKVIVHNKDRERPADFTIDSSKSPRSINVKPPDKDEHLGIYELSGDTLKICIAESGERPTKFESPSESKIMLIELRREKK